MKQFLILYLILTILMQLAAAEEYKKYVRFLSGIILLFALASPILRLLQDDGWSVALASYEQFWEEIDAAMSKAWEPHILQDGYETETYESALEADMVEKAKEKEVVISQIRVELAEDYQIHRVTVWLDMRQKQEDSSAKTRLLEFFTSNYQLEQSQVFIY